MRLQSLILLGLFSLGSACFAQAAAPGSALELYDQCRAGIKLDEGAKSLSVKEETDAFVCLGFVRGVARTVNFMSVGGWDKTLPKAFKSCVPDSVSSIELSRVVVKFLDDNPQNLHYTNTLVTLAAFGHVYPCS